MSKRTSKRSKRISMRLPKSARLAAVLVATAAIAVPAATVAAPSAFAAPPPSKPGQPAKPGQPSSPAQPPAPSTPQTYTLPSTPTQPGPAPLAPPPVDMSAEPNSDPVPGPDPAYHGYQLKTACTTSGSAVANLTAVPWSQQVLQIDTAHQFATGKGETVAVIDTGVNPHNEFQKRLLAGGDFVGYSVPPSSDAQEKAARARQPNADGTFDCLGHGTEVAGIIGANTQGTGWGFDGVAPDANILAVRQTDPNYQTNAVQPGGGSSAQGVAAGNLASLAQAIHHVVVGTRWGHVAAINISLTNCQPVGEGLDLAYKAVQAAIHDAVEHNIVVVAAAGNQDSQGKGCASTNEGPNPNKPDVVSIPAWFSNDVLSVASIAQNGDPSSFSVAGPWVGVAAPGEAITSLDPGKSSGLANTETSNNQTTLLNGTSFAAPYVAGLVALIDQKFNNKLSAKQVIQRIEATAQHPAGPTGRNNKVGYGMINPVAALTDDVAGQNGVQPANTANLPANLPPPYHRNWTPIIVAFAGAGSGLGILLLTLFIVHTIRRNRERQQAT